MHDWTLISGGQHHTLALNSDGKTLLTLHLSLILQSHDSFIYTSLVHPYTGQVYSLGRREYGRLGLGEGCEDVAEPMLISALKEKKVVDISCEGNVSYAVTEDGM